MTGAVTREVRELLEGLQRRLGARLQSRIDSLHQIQGAASSTDDASETSVAGHVEVELEQTALRMADPSSGVRPRRARSVGAAV